MVKKPLLIIVSGPSCSGKSTLAKKISEKYGIPVLSKDGIKEVIFDNLGWSDREWSKKVGGTSIKMLYHLLRSLLISKQPIIIESNFKAELDSDPILDLLNKYGYNSVQIMCRCDGKLLYDRFVKRSESGERHLGHNDQKSYEEFKPTLLRGKLDPLELNSKIIEFDTTDFDNIDYNYVLNELSELL